MKSAYPAGSFRQFLDTLLLETDPHAIDALETQDAPGEAGGLDAFGPVDGDDALGGGPGARGPCRRRAWDPHLAVERLEAIADWPPDWRAPKRPPDREPEYVTIDRR